QKIEILRALARESELIIFDEPTASLGAADAVILFDALRQLRARGTTIIYISHHLDEVLDICDSVTVMRDGQVTHSAAAAFETEQSLIRAMLGRSLSTVFPEKTPCPSTKVPVLSVRGL